MVGLVVPAADLVDLVPDLPAHVDVPELLDAACHEFLQR